jgi:hypothetical protein
LQRDAEGQAHKHQNPGLYLVILTDIGQCVQAARLPRARLLGVTAIAM